MADRLAKLEAENFAHTPNDSRYYYFGTMWQLLSALSLVKMPEYIDLLSFLTEDSRRGKCHFEIQFSQAAAQFLEETFRLECPNTDISAYFD